MPKLESEREMACPCCGAILTIDLNLGRIVSHQDPPNPDRPELDDAHRILAEQARKRDAIFEQSFQAEKEQGRCAGQALRRGAQGSPQGAEQEAAAGI